MVTSSLQGKEGKAIPVTGLGCPQGCETSRLPHFLDNRLTDGGEVVSLKHRPPFTPRKVPGTLSVRGSVDPRAIVRLEGLGKLENPMTSSGGERPASRPGRFIPVTHYKGGCVRLTSGLDAVE
jgi:hypothetical protein